MKVHLWLVSGLGVTHFDLHIVAATDEYAVMVAVKFGGQIGQTKVRI